MARPAALGHAARAPIDDKRRSPMIQRLTTLVLAAALALLAGCNTVHGLGQDIERSGEKLQNAAERAKQ
jgi:entericidin B